MKTPTMAVQAEGCWVAVRYLPKGARYGASRSHMSDHDMVEFYDLSLADDTAGASPPGFGPLGQYITRYNAETLLVASRPDTGLKLFLGVPAWSLDAAAMTTVRAWLRHQHGQRPIRTVTLTDLLEQYDPVTVPVEQVAAALRRWGEHDVADEFQAALITGADEAAGDMADQMGIGFEVAETS